MFGISPATFVILVFIGVLLFGKDLPDVARKVAKSLLDFRRTLHGLHEELFDDRPASRQAQPDVRPTQPPQRIAPTCKKFEDDPPASAEDHMTPARVKSEATGFPIRKKALRCLRSLAS